MSNKPWQVMNETDYDTYKSNKRLYETKGDADGSLNAHNQSLRDKYNISADEYSYDDLQYQSAFGGNIHDKAAQDSLYEAKKYQRYADPYADDLYNTYNEIKNFRYDPKKDPEFEVYKNMYERQGASAQDKTYSNLTALSGGRNNSWASAATAQVGQAYAQKTADVIPQLAQKAYNKLLQEYSILENKSDRARAANQAAFDNAMKEYALEKEQADQYRKIGQNQLDYDQKERDFEHQVKNDEVDNRYKEQQTKNAVLSGEKLQQEIEKNNIELQYLTTKEQIDLIRGYIDIEAAKALIEQRKAQTAKINASI